MTLESKIKIEWIKKVTDNLDGIVANAKIRITDMNVDTVVELKKFRDGGVACFWPLHVTWNVTEGIFVFNQIILDRYRAMIA